MYFLKLICTILFSYLLIGLTKYLKKKNNFLNQGG